MKVHARKKAYRAMIKSLAKAGKINDANGNMISRDSAKESSMTRDYHPQRS